MNIETPSIARTSNNPDWSKQADALTPGEKNLFVKYRSRLEEYRLKSADFSDTYSQDEIEKDDRLVEKIKLKENPKTERGELLEGVIAEQAEQSNWFGDNSCLVTLSEYDDRAAHGDLILELKDGKGKVVRILVDVTTSVDEKILNGKLKVSMDLIKNKALSSIKYFQSDAEDFKGRLPAVPRAVIGISPSLLRELCGDILENKNRQENNPVQLILLDQLENQLVTHWKLAASLYGDDQEITKKLKESLDLIKSISAKKESLRTHDYERKAKQDRTSRLLKY